MVEENLNQKGIGANIRSAQLNVATANENARLMGKYMVSQVVES